MDETAIFKISYGLFYVGSECEGKKSICVVNTVAQVTQEPLRVSVTMLKGGYTHDLIQKSHKFSAAIIGKNAPLEQIAHFGQISTHNEDKLSGYEVQTDILGNPLFSKSCVATLCCKVIQEVDLDTHTIFIADLVDARTLSNEEPITYAGYRERKQHPDSSADNKEVTTEEKAQSWMCKICHYVYDGEIPFEELPDDYVCPVCKKPKSAFIRV